MINLHKRNLNINRLFKDSHYMSDIQVYFARKYAGLDFNSSENNYRYELLNPITIKGVYVRTISLESLVWKEYGLKEVGSKEILCDKRHKNLLETCSKITIDGDEYEVFKEGLGNRVLIQDRPFGMIRAILMRK